MNPLPSLLRFAPLALLLLGSTGAVQTQGSEPQIAADGLPILGRSELVLDQYSVQNVDTDELYRLAQELVGRSYYLRDQGNEVIKGMRVLGTKIVLYDTKEEVQRARELLARLDTPRPASPSSRKSIEYRPHFVSLKTAESAVESLADVSRIPERGLLLLSGEPDDIERVLELMKRIDVPEKQVLLTCQLIEVGGTNPGPALAKELVENLQRLLPGNQFTQAGMAMLKTSVGGENQISMSLETPKENYRLAFTPVAFDEGSASLTVVECRLLQTLSGGERELFRTNTVLRGGEYTVLAATGATPRLIVLRVTPQG